MTQTWTESTSRQGRSEYLKTMSDICYRQMTEDDIEAADGLRRLMGWNQTIADWRRMLRLSPQGCFVAIRDRDLLGTVTSITYDRKLSWIGMMLVHPEHRRQGIGRQLMGQELAYLWDCGVPCIKLDATPMGLPLYTELGFIPEWTLTRWRGQRNVRTPLGSVSNHTRSLRNQDWEAVHEVDKQALGVSRLDLIQGLALHSQRVLVWPSKGRVAGWGLIRAGTNADYLGPIVCADDDGALALVHALLFGSGDRPVFWDVPDGNPGAAAAVQQLGFNPIRALTRMRLGPAILKSRPQAQFAIADPSSG